MASAITMYNAMRSTHSMSTRARLVTAGEFFHMPDDDCKSELVEGRVLRMPLPGWHHGLITANLGAALCSFVEDRGLGAAVIGTGYKLASDPDTVRAPDISFISRARVGAAMVARTYWDAPPDLAVEVLSPDDEPSWITGKTQDYLRARVHLLWVIDPDPQTVTVYRASVAPVVLTADQDLDGQDVIPGFRYPIRKLFE